MAANPAVHPPADVLQAFAFGKLNDSTASAIVNHLDSCPDCCKQAAALSGDAFLHRLRQAHGRSFTPAPAKALPQETAGSKPSLPTIPPNDTTPNLPVELSANPQYEILRELGRGGMGVVYLAKNKLMDRLEVLKVVNKMLLDRPGAIERFLREIRSAAKLSHANVVAAYSAVQQGELLAFAMEYIEGQDLASLVKARGPLPVVHACYYVQQAAWGLQHAFDKGMVHRDIKPQNLILAREGKKHTVKVLDFGLAKVMREKGDDTGLTGEGKMLGTPDYIAPEQTLDAARADIRADIYSLGCTLYYLLSGHPPFSANSLGAILLAHQMQEARPLNLVRPEVPEELAAVVRKMMAKSPAKRYQTPLEVVQALTPFVKQGATPKPAPELSAGTHLAKPALKVAALIEPPPAPAADLPKPPPTPAGVWGSLSEDSSASVAPRKSAAIRKSRAATVRERSSTKKWLLGSGIGVGVLLLALLGMWAGGVFDTKVQVRTKDGLLVIEVNEPNPEVLVDGERVTVSWHNGGKKAEMRVPSGTHNVEVKKDGFSMVGKELTFKDGDKEIFTVRLLPEQRATKADTPAPGQAPPPTTPRNDYDDLAKGRWFDLLPSVEEFNRLQNEKSYRGAEPIFVDGNLECEGQSNLFFPSAKARDVILRAQIKRFGPKGRGNVSIGFHNANNEIVSVWFNGGGHVGIGRRRNRSWKELTSVQLDEPYDDFFELAFAVVEDKLIAYVNGRRVLEARNDGPLDRPVIAEIGTGRNPGGTCKGLIRNIQVQVLDKSPAAGEIGFLPLFNGKDLTGWKTNPEGGSAWKVENGVLIWRSLDFCSLRTERNDYRDFHLRLETRIGDGHYAQMVVRGGYVVVLNSTNGNPQRTGSFGVVGGGTPVRVRRSLVAPEHWFTLELIAEGNHFVVKVNGETTANYSDPAQRFGSGNITLNSGNRERDGRYHLDFRKIEIKELK